MATVSRMRPSCICSTGDSWKVFTPSLEGEAEQYSKSNPLRKFTLDPLVQLKHHTKFDTVVQKSGWPPGMYTTGAARFLKHQTHTETHAQDTNLENGIHSYDQLIKVWNLSCQEMFSDFLAISWGENKPYHLRCIIYVLPKETYLWTNYNKYISKYYTMITTPMYI